VINLNEGDDLLLTIPEFYSNPYSDFEYYFNNTLITTGHIMQNYTNSSTIFKTLQGTSLSATSVDHTNSGVYTIKACNEAGCKIDEWRVVVQCK